jgi:hypothetical protein
LLAKVSFETSVKGSVLDNEVVEQRRQTAFRQVGGGPKAHHPLAEKRFPAVFPPPNCPEPGPPRRTPEPGQLGATPPWAILFKTVGHYRDIRCVRQTWAEDLEALPWESKSRLN